MPFHFKRKTTGGSINTHLLAVKVRQGENDRFIVGGMGIHENQGKFYYEHELVEIENADFQSGLPGTTGVDFESASPFTIIQNLQFSSSAILDRNECILKKTQR